MNYIIFILLLLLSNFSLASPSCSKNGTTVIYTNGVTTPRDNAEKAKVRIRDLELNSQLDLKPEKVKYILAYNYSESFGKDFLEAAVQRFPKTFIKQVGAKDNYAAYMPYLNGKMNDPAYSNVLNSISEVLLDRIDIWVRDYFNDTQYLKSVSEIKGHYETSLNNGERVYAISHSQGGLFMRDAYNALTFSDKEKYFAGLQIASPLNALPSGHFNWATHDKDRLINTLRSLFGALPGNLDSPLVVSNSFEGIGDYAIDFILNHGITSTYLYDEKIKSQVVSKLISTAQLLESNCPKELDLKIDVNQFGKSVYFTALISNVGIYDFIYHWDFGDGTTEVGPELYSIQHAYLKKGEKVVTLVLEEKSTGKLRDPVQVTVNIEDPLPDPEFSIQLPYNNSLYVFVSETFIDKDIVLEWDFGDGRPHLFGTQVNIPYFYYSPGEYIITLKITSPSGDSKSISHKIHLYPGPGEAYQIY